MIDKSYTQWLSDEEKQNISKSLYCEQNKEYDLKLIKRDIWPQNHNRYTIQCPKCKSHEQIWPRGVIGQSDLDSNGDSMAIAFECEDCSTIFHLIIAKHGGLDLSLKQVGYHIYDY